MEVCQERRGQLFNMEYLSTSRVVLTYDLPLAEILMEFFDRLKSKTQGYASLDYEFLGYRESDLVKLDILVSGKIVDALSVILHKDSAYQRGRQLTVKRQLIPRQMFEVPIHASSEKVIAQRLSRHLGRCSCKVLWW